MSYRRLSALCAVIGAVACTATTAPVVGPPAALLVVAGDLQTDTVGQELPEPLVVRVVDANDHPVAGQVINFRIIAGEGSVYAGVAVTDKEGEARERWTLGATAADTQVVEARAVDTQTGEAIVFGRFRAVGVADVAATVAVHPASVADSAAFVGGDSVLTGDSVSLTLVARDRHGNVKETQTATWATSDSVVADVSETGLVRVLQPGAATITATVDTATGRFAIKGQLRVPVTLEVLAGAAQSDTVDATLASALEVRALDRRGRGFQGAEITFRGLNSVPADTMPGCGCSVVLTDADGVAATAWVLGTQAGEASMDAVGRYPAAGTVFDSVRAAATVLRGAADNMAKVAGGGSATGLVVAVRDRHGNPVSGVVVAWAVAAGTGSLSDALTVTNVNGLAGTSVTSATGTITVEASATGLAGSPLSFSVTISSAFALAFNLSQVVVPDDAALDLGANWTLEAWVKPDVVNSLDHVISKWSSGCSGNDSYTMEIHQGRLRSAVCDGTTLGTFESAGFVSTGVWQHLAITFDNGTMRFYINGALDSTKTGLPIPMNSSRTLTFGAASIGAQQYFGLLDEVRAWNVTRSGSEIGASWNQRLNGSEAGLVGYWRFDEGSGDVAFDATGNGHHGQLGSAVGVDANDPQWTTDVPPIP